MLGYGAISFRVKNKFLRAPNPTYKLQTYATYLALKRNYERILIPNPHYILKSAIAPFVMAAIALSVALGR